MFFRRLNWMRTLAMTMCWKRARSRIPLHHGDLEPVVHVHQVVSCRRTHDAAPNDDDIIHFFTHIDDPFPHPCAGF